MGRVATRRPSAAPTLTEGGVTHVSDALSVAHQKDAAFRTLSHLLSSNYWGVGHDRWKMRQATCDIQESSGVRLQSS